MPALSALALRIIRKALSALAPPLRHGSRTSPVYAVHAAPGAPGIARRLGRRGHGVLPGPPLLSSRRLNRSRRQIPRHQRRTPVGGQHDAFARGPRRGLLALSTLRHRNSYE
ncbi:hypothetical protein STRIP9103_04147 [Streptomyces ipomoeae 91-03]|uniref:Uncharacterized protein n=1 Tax=Streptomyces ipomoeae 91-03 TaxID=698759 RepID=L1KK63_9ACTN|nr:hypothetical protein STRIP9103_04147 [Streptomyces ipomoeae 91-03]